MDSLTRFSIDKEDQLFLHTITIFTNFIDMLSIIMTSSTDIFTEMEDCMQSCPVSFFPLPSYNLSDFYPETTRIAGSSHREQKRYWTTREEGRRADLPSWSWLDLLSQVLKYFHLISLQIFLSQGSQRVSMAGFLWQERVQHCIKTKSFKHRIGWLAERE